MAMHPLNRREQNVVTAWLSPRRTYGTANFIFQLPTSDGQNHARTIQAVAAGSSIIVWQPRPVQFIEGAGEYRTRRGNDAPGLATTLARVVID